MAERDVALFPMVVQTNTSIALKTSSYNEVKVMLEQDFGLARVIRGVSQKTLGVVIKDLTDTPADPDLNVVNIDIYDSFGNTILSAAETRIGVGNYDYVFVPAANLPVGLYKATHSFTVGAVLGSFDEWFRVVATLPGDYAGSIIRNEQTWHGQIGVVNTLGQLVDPDGEVVTYTIYDPRGIAIVTNQPATRAGTGVFTAAYAPTPNDPLGTYNAVFTFQISAVSGSLDNFFEVVERKNELVVNATDFKASIEGKMVAKVTSDWTDTEFDAVLADAQNRVEDWLTYKLGKQIVLGERIKAKINNEGQIAARFRTRPIQRVIRALLQYHPMLAPLVLPNEGWVLYHDQGEGVHVIGPASIISGAAAIIGFIDWLYQDKVHLIVDYEAGNDIESLTVKQSIRVMAAGMIDEILNITDVKSVVSGNHKIEYFDSQNLGGIGKDGFSKSERRAYEILNKAGLIRPPVY